MSTSVGLAHDKGWDQTRILSNLCCVSKERWKSWIKRTIRIEVWENRIKHTHAEQMEEAVAVWPAWKVHFTAFKSQTHTHTYTTLKASLKAKLVSESRSTVYLGNFSESDKSFYLHSLWNLLCFLYLFFFVCVSVILFPISNTSHKETQTLYMI